MFDEMNTGKCNGCKWHGKSDETFWRYLDGSPRNDTCSRPTRNPPIGYEIGEPIPVFNVGCKDFEPEGSA